MNKAINLCIVVIAMVALLSSCETLKHYAKRGFSEGFYRTNLHLQKVRKVYVLPSDDVIKVFSVETMKKNIIDTSESLKINFPADSKPLDFQTYFFRKNSFDLQALTVLFRYRPALKVFPAQLTQSYNATAYIGYRTDIYRLSYKKTPLQLYHRSITHYGFSVGVFSGIGSERVDEFNTLGALSTEYDGIVSLSGIAAILAINKVSFGVALGADHLLDKHREIWVSNGKPWIGLTISLNLN
jgi:hypothetical protein